MSATAALKRPLLVVAQALPFQSSGTSIVLRRLLHNFTPGEIVLVARAPNRHMRLREHPLEYPVIRVPSLPGGLRGERYWRLASVPTGIAAGLWAVRRYRPAAILAVFPDECALLTGYVLHRLTGLPLLAYFCDLYLEDPRSVWEAALARWLQPRVFRAASRVIAVNDGMASYYARHYGLDPLCLPACINVPIRQFSPAPSSGKPFVIGYSGNINSTRVGSLRALIGAVGGNHDYVIRYFTPQKPGYLKSLGVWADNATASFVSDESDLIHRLSACDALFLPLTFEVVENSVDQLATCFATKSFEYFLSQKPVILHAPPDYFITQFFRQWDCGMVVDDPSSGALAAALQTLRSDRDLSARLAANALRAARQFEGPRVAALLRSAVHDVIDGTGRTSPGGG